MTQPQPQPQFPKWEHNPGSDAALDAGCICPVMDNNRGRWAPYPPNGWWMVPGCPYHQPGKGAA